MAINKFTCQRLLTCTCVVVLMFTWCNSHTLAATGSDSILNNGIFSSEPWSLDRDLETPTLNNWRENAQSSLVGEELLYYLDRTNAALQSNASDGDALYRRAYLYGLIGCTRMAISDLSKALTQDASQAAWHRERGVCFIDMKNYEKALNDLNQSVNLNPSSGDSRLARARLLLLMGKPQQALDDLLICQRASMEFKPVLPGELAANHYKTIDYYLGACYEALGRKHEAIRCYRDATNVEPGMRGAYVHRYADQPTDAADCVKRLQGY